MSWFFFIASDKPLDEYCLGIQQNGNAIIIENENRTLNIYREDYRGYTEQYTDLKNIVGIEFRTYENTKAEIFEYIKKATEVCGQLELWSIWMDDPDRDIQIRRFKDDQFSEDDLEWILGHEFFEHPQCLKMYKWRR